MPTPIDHGFPVKRPGFIESANWVGTDDDLQLTILFTDLDSSGQPFQRSLSFQAGTEICVPGSQSMSYSGLSDDMLLASIRMSTMISKTIAGSIEWKEAALKDAEGNAKNFQTNIGDVFVEFDDVEVVDDERINVPISKKNAGTRVVQMVHSALSEYKFEPNTQLLILPGSLKKAFPGYEHDYPSNPLTSGEKQDILDYVLALKPWA